MNNQITWIDRIFSNRILSHVVFWLAILVGYPIYVYATFGQPVYYSFIEKFFYLIPQIMAAYLLVYYQIPRFIYRRKYGLFFLSFLGSLAFFSTLCHIVDDYAIYPILENGHEPHSIQDIILGTFPQSVFHIVFSYMIPFLMAGVKMIKQKLEEKQQLERLKKEKAHVELQLLKAQIHPHFLFNTLENLYELSLKKSDAAPEVVVKLSEMLDYMLYECHVATVPIQREVELIQNFIDLEELYREGRLEIVFSSLVEDPSAEIAPLILLTVVEQAFKTVENLSPAQQKAVLTLRVKDEQLKLQFGLFFDSKNFPQKPDIISLQRQLDLLYPDHYELTEQEKNDQYSMELNIDLCNNHVNA